MACGVDIQGEMTSLLRLYGRLNFVVGSLTVNCDERKISACETLSANILKKVDTLKEAIISEFGSDTESWDRSIQVCMERITGLNCSRLDQRILNLKILQEREAEEKTAEEAGPCPLSEEEKGLLIESPISLLNSRPTRMKGHPLITECNCLSGLSRTGDARYAIERKIIEKITGKVSSGGNVKIMSVGAGGCFQELVLTAQLNLLGYTADWTLVDPGFFSAETRSHAGMETMEEFGRLIGDLHPDNHFRAFGTVDHVIEERDNRESEGREEPFSHDVVMCVDLDESLVAGEKRISKQIFSGLLEDNERKRDQNGLLSQGSFFVTAQKTRRTVRQELKATAIRYDNYRCTISKERFYYS